MKTLLMTAALIAATAPAALAGPLPTYNIVLGDGAAATAYYVGHEAADTDVAALVLGGGTFFDNQTTPIGTARALGTFVAGTEIEFSMTDLTVPGTYYTGPGSRNSDGDVHAFVTQDPALIYGWGTLPAADRAYALSMESPTTTFVGFEDRAGPQSDFDYNDLVFVVREAQPGFIPEPAAFGILGTALIFFGLLRTRGNLR